MATLVEWFPADGSAPARFTTGPEAPLRLMRLEGTEPVTVEAVTIKSPNQPGATAVDVVVPPRVVTLGGLLAAASPAAAWDLRAVLLRSLAQQPTRLGEASHRLLGRRVRARPCGHGDLKAQPVWVRTDPDALGDRVAGRMRGPIPRDRGTRRAKRRERVSLRGHRELLAWAVPRARGPCLRAPSLQVAPLPGLYGSA
jgi:hypothetical protein